MTGNEFLKKLKRLSESTGIVYSFDAERGKGSHGTAYFGNERTTVKNLKEEIGIGLLHEMCAQLKIKTKDLRGNK